MAYQSMARPSVLSDLVNFGAGIIISLLFTNLSSTYFMSDGYGSVRRVNHFPRAVHESGWTNTGPLSPKCSSWLSPSRKNVEDAWYSLKKYPKPSPCKINGLMIEELDPEFNFRRAYNLGFEKNADDMQYLVPFFRAFQDSSLQDSDRRVLLDLGGKTFEKSVAWFLRLYPLSFTEVHVFEPKLGLFQVPRYHSLEVLYHRFVISAFRVTLTSSMFQNRWTYNESTRQQLRSPLPVQNWCLDTIRSHVKFAGLEDSAGRRRVNITRFIKQYLKLSAEDTLIVKMDIGAEEWTILPAWMADPNMPLIVDELFVKVHYKDPSMSKFGWDKYSHTRKEATKLLSDLRDRGFFAHHWP